MPKYDKCISLLLIVVTVSSCAPKEDFFYRSTFLPLSPAVVDSTHQEIRHDQQGREVIFSDGPKTQLLLSVATDHAWDELGPTILMALRNKSDTPVEFDIDYMDICQDRNGRFVIDYSDDGQTALTAPMIMDAGMIRSYVFVTSVEKQREAETNAALAAFAAGFVGGLGALPGSRVNFAPAAQSVAEQTAQTSAAVVRNSSEESGALMGNSGTFFKDGPITVRPNETIKGAFIIGHVRLGQRFLIGIWNGDGRRRVFDKASTFSHPIQLIQRGYRPLPIPDAKFQCDDLRP